MNLEYFKKKALEFDKNDPLAHFREKFFHAQDNTIYLDGNSLGKLPISNIEKIEAIVTHHWGSRMIRSWNENWIGLPNRIAEKLAKIVGAKPDEIFIGDSTSINFYKLVFATLKLQENRNEVITHSLNFPTNFYVLQGLIENHFETHRLKIIESDDQISISEKNIESALSQNTALLTFSHVLYKSAYMYDMAKINDMAHQNGAFTLWDLSHSVGVVPIHLNETNADLAVGCTYKYLNGGPGSSAFLYVRKDLQERLTNPIWAWFSHKNPFEFGNQYQPSDSINKFATGTPSILSLAPIESGLEIILEAGIKQIRQKSSLQSQLLIEMTQNLLTQKGFSIASPLEIQYRGSHISLQHPEGFRISKALIEPKDDSPIIIPDFRPPNNIRIGIAPLYNTFMEVFQTVERLVKIIEEKQYEDYDESKNGVT